jgi:ribose 5-phosphate isomerase A
VTERPLAGADDPSMHAVGSRALEFIADGMRVGLGSGRTASVFIRLLGGRVRDGLRVSGVPASSASAALARESGIPLIDLAENAVLDLTVDGADEVAPNLDLIKGHGGALVRERIVAAASKRQIILVGHDKIVRALGERFRLPVEVIPFGAGPVIRALKHLRLAPAVRLSADGAGPLVNENGNLTLDCALHEPLADPVERRELESVLLAMAGVVDTGLFLGTAERVLVGHPDGRVETLVAAAR